MHFLSVSTLPMNLFFSFTSFSTPKSEKPNTQKNLNQRRLRIFWGDLKKYFDCSRHSEKSLTFRCIKLKFHDEVRWVNYLSFRLINKQICARCWKFNIPIGSIALHFLSQESCVNALKLYTTFIAFVAVRIYVLTCKIRIYHFLDHEVVSFLFFILANWFSMLITLLLANDQHRQSFFNYLIAQCFLAPKSWKYCFNLMPNPQPAHNTQCYEQQKNVQNTR